MPDGLYRRGAVWWGRVQVAGREHRRSLRTVSRPEAQAHYEAWRKRLIAEGHFGIVTHRWEEAVLQWGAEAGERVKPSTAKRYKVSLKQIGPLLVGMDVRRIGKAELVKIAARRGPTPATRKRDIVAVTAVLRACERWGWIEAVPALAKDHLVERRDPIVLPSEADVHRWVAACHASHKREQAGTLGYLLLFLRQTGMRLEEAATLLWRQVDLNRRAITLYATKNGRGRTITLSAQAVGTLRAVTRRMDVQHVFWHGKEGQPYSNVSSRLRAIGQCCKPPITFRAHDLRHLYAVTEMRAGRAIYDLSQHLGHASVTTTEKFYLRYLTPEEQAVAKR